MPFTSGPFAVSQANLAESTGTVTCPICQEMADSLQLTPAGPCLSCADRSPGMTARPHSDPFWILSPEKVTRLEHEIQRLVAELDRMNSRFAELRQRHAEEGNGRYRRALEEERDRWHALQRELHLLHLLRAASRQFGT